MRGERKELMLKLFAKGGRYQRLIERGERRIKKFGLKRFIFFIRFSAFRKRLERIAILRDANVMAALAISKKLQVYSNLGLKNRNRLDH